jgi:hypothetical protein
MSADPRSVLGMVRAAAPDGSCALETDEMDGRLAAWRDVAASATTRETIDGGLRLGFDAIDVRALTDLAIREHECCPFLAFSIGIGPRGTTLEISGPADARVLIDVIA